MSIYSMRESKLRPHGNGPDWATSVASSSLDNSTGKIGSVLDPELKLHYYTGFKHVW